MFVKVCSGVSTWVYLLSYVLYPRERRGEEGREEEEELRGREGKRNDTREGKERGGEVRGRGEERHWI